MTLDCRALLQRGYTWISCAQRREKARVLCGEMGRAFTRHPQETGETYMQHLWFTAMMAARLLYSLLVLLVHGIFPFLLSRAASSQIEVIYRIIKTRIPKSRRDAIDADIDYCV